MRALATRTRIQELLRHLGQASRTETRVYLTGGATAVLEGWRESTIDVDLKLDPDSDELLRAIASLKNQLDINVELAAPDQFIPAVPGWQERSRYIDRVGKVTFLHYDPYSQALAKIERGHSTDRLDVQAMARRGLIAPDALQRHFEQIEPLLYRFPAIDPRSFRAAVADCVHNWPEAREG